jgi:hypothetical protein
MRNLRSKIEESLHRKFEDTLEDKIEAWIEENAAVMEGMAAYLRNK